MSVENKNPITNWNIGDRCWFEENWSNIPNQATIETIEKSPVNEEVLYAKLHCITVPGTTSRPLTQLFRSKKDVLDAQAEKSKSRIQKYEEDIQTVEDLVKFGYDHNVAGAEEYTDWDARTAYRNRAKALLGIELED